MKKLITIVLAALVAVSTGCGSKCRLEVERDPETGKVTVRGSCDFPNHEHRE